MSEQVARPQSWYVHVRRKDGKYLPATGKLSYVSSRCEDIHHAEDLAYALRDSQVWGADVDVEVRASKFPPDITRNGPAK